MTRKNGKITTIAEVREYAMQNYNNGGDGIIECYEDAQIQEILDTCAKADRSVRKYLDGMFRDAEQVRLDRQGIEAYNDLPCIHDNCGDCEHYNGTECDGDLPVEDEEFEQKMAEAEEQQTTEEIKAIQKEMKKSKKSPKRTRQAEMMTVGEISLTPKQVLFIQSMPTDNFYENGLDSALWIDIYADTLEAAGIMGRMTAGAMVTTLREKGILAVGHSRREKKSIAHFEFTEFGKTIAAQLGLH